MSEQYFFDAAADDDLWRQYTDLATRSYGHTIADIARLRDHADLRVATRGSQVVAGGLGLLVPQYFGGKPIPSACLSAGCVAPEVRGDRLAARMTDARLRPLRERGAVISAISTSSNGYARHLGWEAPTHVFAWTVRTDDLKRSFNAEDFDIERGLSPDAPQLQRQLAQQWNGPVCRPAWWEQWKQAKGDLTTYCFHRPGHPVAGLLSLAMRRHPHHGMNLSVHDFWASDQNVAAAMYAFLGRHNARAETVEFRRGALPPTQTLLHNLHRCRMQVQAWHPWMLRILDIRQATQLRGWPIGIDIAVPIEIQSNDDVSTRYELQINNGSADINVTTKNSTVAFTQRQLAVWFAGGYRTVTSARLDGVHATSDTTLAVLIRSTTEHEPWLPDHF